MAGDDTTRDGDVKLRSAEEWLAQRGVERRPIVVRLEEPEPDLGATPEPAATPAATPAPVGAGIGGGHVPDDDAFDDEFADDGFPDDVSGELPEDVARALAEAAAPLIPVASPGQLRAVDASDRMTPPRAIETMRVAEAADHERRHLADLEAAEPRDRPSLGDDVAIALAYVRQATSLAPMSEGRVRTKLADRDHPEPVIELTLERARKERLVDDEAFASALVQEYQAKGHAGSRIRMDLRTRGFDNAFIAKIMAGIESPDPEAAAFAVARERAPSLSGLEPEAALRRLTAYLARRGHPEWLSAKVARQVLWADREEQQTAGH